MRRAAGESPHDLYGLVAEFETPEALRDAARHVRRHGYRRVQAYTPFPVEGLAEEVGFRFNWLPVLVLFGGFGGAALGYFGQWFACVLSYPLNVGGRPLHSWPSFIPITFELGVLFASLTAFGGMLALNGLPQPYHPIFSAPHLSRESRGRFFLCVEATDPVFEPAATRALLQTLHPREVYDAPLR
jgi:hypothetical protein